MSLLLTVVLEHHFLSQDPLSQKVVVAVVVLMGLVHLVVKEDLVVVLMDHLQAQIQKHQVHQQTLPLVVAVVVGNQESTHQVVGMVDQESFT